MKPLENNVAVATTLIAPFVKQTVLGYQEAGLLQHFFTSYVYDRSRWMNRVITQMVPALERELSRRAFSELPAEFLKLYPYRELLRSVAARKLSATTTDAIWEWSELAFDRWMARKLSPRTAWVHTYEHIALQTLKAARRKGVRTIYEQPSQHHAFFTPVVKEQLQLYPGLASRGNELLIDEKAARRNRRRDEELALADRILCTSSFTRRTLVAAGVEEGKIRVIPYGFPKPLATAERPDNGKVIFLNAGNQNLRKALHLLYKAWRECAFAETEAELWLIGKMELPEELRRDLPGKVVIKNNIPHSELMELYKQVDVFVLPTLADGFGMVISEAMASGVPVITTENSGGPDIITHMENGWIVKAGELEPLVQQLRWCVANRDRLAGFGRAAHQKAKSWQWSDYRKAVPGLVTEPVTTKEA